MGKIIAAYGGGFKPPTRGHFEIVDKALKEFPEIDEFFIYVGSKERNEIDQEEAILVWDIYHNYLANKVVIEPSDQPIRSILRLAKENPQDTIYFVIGYREGRNDDLEDVAARTGNLGEKYPNIEVKVVPTQDPNMSGTNARKALKVSQDEFIKFLPFDLTMDEKIQVYNIVRPAEKLNEEITKSQLDAIESYADGLFNKLGIDIDFTKHFLERVNDIRNKKPISVAELIGVFKKLFKKHGKPLSRTEDDLEAVVKDFNKNLNIPFVIDVDQNGIDMTAKTIMRKSDFQTTNPIIPLEEDEDNNIVPEAELILPRGKKVILQAEDTDYKRGLIVELLDNGGYEMAYWYDKPDKPYPVEILVDGVSIKPDGKIVEMKFHPQDYYDKQDELNEGDTYEKMAAKGKKAGNLKQGTVRKRLNIPKDKKIPLSKINKEISRLKKMDKDKDKKGVQLGDKNQKYYKALQLSKTLKTTTNVNENATYSNHIDYKQQIKDLTKYMLDKGFNIRPLPLVRFVHNEKSNAKNFFGKTAYYDPNENLIVLFTEGRHPKDIVRSFAHEMIHHIQNLEDRLDNVNTTNTNSSQELDSIEREAYVEGNMIFRNWTDSIDGDVTSSIQEKKKKKDKDVFGLNAYARELAMGLQEAIVNEGKYDSLVTKLAGFTLNAWKDDLKEKAKKGFIRIEVGPGKDFDYPHLDFDYKATANFGGIYSDKSFARPLVPEVVINMTLDVDELPRMWEQISMDLRNTIRHEIEHLMQSGPNVKKGKEKERDYEEREEIKTGKKKWWKIWRKTLGTPDYYKLEKEVDANLQGLYLKAKKQRTPLKDVIDNYVKYTLNLPADEQEEVKRIWAERAPVLNIPLEEGRKKKKDPKKGTGKKPKGSSRRLYTDEDPKDTVGVKFSTRQDIVDTLNKKSFKSRSHARQSQVINLIHQRTRAAYNRTKDPVKKKRLKTALDYITKRKEASKKKTQRLKKQKNENVVVNHDGKSSTLWIGFMNLLMKTQK